MPTGTVKLLVVKRGYGFITFSNGEDVFFAHDAVPAHGFRKLTVGQEVEFEWAGKGQKSVKGPRAKWVTPATPTENPIPTESSPTEPAPTEPTAS
jgi:CspA family cold shock protein